MVTLAQITDILRSAKEPFALLPLHDGAQALVTERGARVLGLFMNPKSHNLLWTNQAAFRSLDDFQQFVTQGGWNLGGERIWIAPEIQYNVRDRSNFWGTLSVPPQMDPGIWRLSDSTAVGDAPPKTPKINIETRSDFVLTAHNLATNDQIFFIERFIAPVANPLRHYHHYAELESEVKYAGYFQQVTLDAEHTSTVSEVWNLVQLNAGGQLIIPCAPVVTASDYFGHVPAEVRQIHRGDVPHLRIPITGRQQYKVGYQSFSMTGRMGYWHMLPDSHEYLLIRTFFNNPSNLYAEEPPDQPGVNGHSVHVYNDGGEFGEDTPFGEMECTGQTVCGGTRITLEDATTDTFILWAYTGSSVAIRQIAHLLLGVRL